jgi:Domain of unknown function (DUF4384)
MKIDKENDARFLAYLAWLPVVAVLLLAARLEPQTISQTPPSPLNARDLFYERIDALPGLQCRILLRDTEGEYRPVSIDSLFRTNDRIRLAFESNTAGFLYVLQQGSDSTWDILFPSAEIRDNDNRIAPMRPVRVPREQDFIFDLTPGQETLFVVLSLHQEPDLERLLDFVRSPHGTATERQDAASLVKAIFTDLNAGLASRNLRVYRNNGGASSGVENAVYAVNTDVREGRVISKLVLNHKR